MVRAEVLDELREPPGEIAGLELLRVRQIERRAGLDGHVAVGHRALEGQHRGEPVDVRGIGRRLLLGEETEVVVAVHVLRRAPGLTTLTCEVTW